MAGITGRKIRDAALNIFRTKGLDETTMHDVAAEAGVATGAAYYYFPLEGRVSTLRLTAAFFEPSKIEPIRHTRLLHSPEQQIIGTVDIAWFQKILGDGEDEPGESAPPRR
jgi:hypothetical protein